jgi:hypothetical protein
MSAWVNALYEYAYLDCARNHWLASSPSTVSRLELCVSECSCNAIGQPQRLQRWPLVVARRPTELGPTDTRLQSESRADTSVRLQYDEWRCVSGEVVFFLKDASQHHHHAPRCRCTHEQMMCWRAG